MYGARATNEALACARPKEPKIGQKHKSLMEFDGEPSGRSKVELKSRESPSHLVIA